MARADLLVNLVQTGMKMDKARFRKVVEAIIAEERSKNHKVLAEKLEDVLRNIPADRPVSNGTPVFNQRVSNYVHEVVPKRKIDEWIRNFKDERKRCLSTLQNNYDLQKLKYRVYLLKGEAERLIPELAKEREVELIVMGTFCQTGIAGFFIGNTAEKILHRVDCSVLTIKSDGFITPVKIG